MSSDRDTLVSIGLPIRNGERTVERVVRSVLAQNHEHIELVISDNASTDRTEEICRMLAAADERISYHRRPVDIGLVPNFLGTLAAARGRWFRWIGDGDRLDPSYVSRCLSVAADDSRLILVSTQIGYELADGSTTYAVYGGTELGSADPAVRFAEMLRLLTGGFALLDPLYSLVRRERVEPVPYRRMLRGDEVYAARIALAGPWGHVPEVLAHRGWEAARPPQMAPRLGVPKWHAPIATELQCRELLRAVHDADLTPPQRRHAQAAVARLYGARLAATMTRARRRVSSPLGTSATVSAGRASTATAAAAGQGNGLRTADDRIAGATTRRASADSG